MNMHVIGNQLEAILWFFVALVCLVRSVSVWRNSAKFETVKRNLIASAAFLMFGISDLVEIQTGAWWRPLWLLAWKAACILVFVWLFWRSRQQAK